jgi:hypothetical protein
MASYCGCSQKAVDVKKGGEKTDDPKEELKRRAKKARERSENTSVCMERAVHYDNQSCLCVR